MSKLPPEFFPAMSDSERRHFEDAIRQQEMIDRLIGPRGIEMLQAYRPYEELERLAKPELDLIREHQDLMSGVTAQQEALRAALEAAVDLDPGRMRDLEGAFALNAAAERAAREGSGLAELKRARDAIESTGVGLYNDAMREYGTFASVARVHEDLESVWREHAGTTELKRAMKIASPWIDMQDPLRSIAAFQQASQIGEAVRALAIDPTASFHTLDPLLGAWTPPAGFASWSGARRLDAYAKAGVDMRMFDIPREAYFDIAREVGIMLPAQPTRSWRASYMSASAQGRGRVFAVRGSLRLEARRRVILIELRLRDELEERARVHFNGQGVEVIIDVSRLKKIEGRRARARFGKTPRLLDHSQFSDLSTILQDAWMRCFSDVPIPLDELRVLMANLVEIRNALFHHRPLDAREINVLFAATERLERAFGVKPHKPLTH